MTKHSTGWRGRISKIVSILQPNRMNNDEWTAFKDKLTPAQLEAVEAAQRHYFDDALTSYLKAFLEMLQGHEAHLEGLRGQQARYVSNQDLVVQYLQRQEGKLDGLAGLPEKVETVSTGLSALAGTFSETVERLDDWRSEVDQWRKGIDSWRVGVDADIASFKKSRDDSFQRHQDTQEHRAHLQAEREQDRKTLDELLTLVHRLGVDVAALKEQGSGG